MTKRPWNWSSITRGNRRLFCRVLDRRDDQQALRALWFVAESNGEIESLMGKGTPYYGRPEDVVGLAARLRLRSRAGDPQVSGVAKATLDYVEQRFGKELAQRQERARAQATDAVAWVEAAADAEGLKTACNLATGRLHWLQKRWAGTPLQEHVEACLAKVEACEKKIPEKLPESPDAAGESERWLKRARTAMAAGHWPVAWAWLDRIVREHPDAPAAQEAQRLLPECRQKCAEP
jgi:hypothetical protein